MPLSWFYGLEACFCIGAELISCVRVKVSRRIVPYSPLWDSEVRTLANRPRGRFAWTNHIYFQVTQLASITVTPLHQ